MYLLTEPTAYRLPTATTPMLTIASVVQISSYRKQRVLQIRVTSHNISVKPRFFRAYCYFDLLQLFGNVIVVTTPIDVTAPEMQAARNDRSEVADLIIQDLKDAAELLPVTSTVEKGRVGREGAWAMLSRVALYEGTWQKFRGNTARGKDLLDIAANAAKEVINTKKLLTVCTCYLRRQCTEVYVYPGRYEV